MSNEGKSLPIHEMDTNLLFEKFTVEEIRNIEKRTRSDIERKKEDLRTMVGERYRDLIEAADTITEMKNSSQNVKATIGRIETLCSDLKQSQMIKGSSLQQRRKLEMDNKRKEEARFHGVASQIKLLLDIPEKIWTCLDCEDYLTASRLYLLSQHINTSLHLDSQNSPNFLYWFPVLNRQWAAISHFKITILQGCRKLLKEPSVPDQKIADSLCSILLLENSNPRQVFNEFLLARTSAVQQLFHVSSETNSSTKDQICTIVQLVTTTIHQIHAVFYAVAEDATGSEEQSNTGSSNLLLRILSKVTSEKQCDSGLIDLQSSVSARCLPKSVTDFCPSHKSVSMGISQQHLHDNCTQWMQTCTSDVQTGVGKLLHFVNTVKHLATIRDTVWELMSNDTSLENWDFVCQRVLNKTLYIWDDLLRPLFVERVKALIKYQLDTTVELTERQIRKVTSDLDNIDTRCVTAEVDLASYVWTESPSDVAMNTAWGSAGSRSLLESGGLMMKAKAYTPVVQSLCKILDEKLKGLKEDLVYYLYSDTESHSVTMETKPFNRYGQTKDLLVYIQDSCVESLQGILKFFKDLVTESKKILEEADKRCNTTGNKLLLAGRLCAAMCDLTPNLQQCMLGHERLQRQQDGTRPLKKSSSGRAMSTRADSTSSVWDKVKAMLVQHQHMAYRVWIDHIVRMVLQDFSMALQSQDTGDLVRTSARWEDVSIQEETEDGKKIASNISVPMQASWYLLSLLYSLCSDLNRIGGHAVARSVLEHLVVGISDGISGTYTKLLSARDTTTSVNQHRALQLLFDVRFLLMILPRKDDTKESKQYQSRMAKVVSQLEEVIDPFDLDVFSPFIQSNLTKFVQRSSVLLGGLTSLDKSGLYGLSTRQPSSSQQEQHNVLQLSSCQNRFALLPLSSQQSRYSVPQPVITQTLYRGSDSSGPSLTETAAAVLPHHSQHKMNSSSSFYDKLGSMSDISNWFSTIGQK